MEAAVRTARRAAMIAVACGSGGFGLLMIWILVRPGVIARVATVEMLVVLGLFLLPVATLAAWFMDHRAIGEEPADETVDSAAAGMESFAGERVDGPLRIPGRHVHGERVESPARRGTGERRHRRAVGVGDRA